MNKVKNEELTPFPPQDGSPAIELQLAGVTRRDPEYRIERFSSGEIVFEYVFSGRGVIICGGEEFRVSAGDAYVLPSGTTHRYWSDAADPWEKVWFNVRGPLVEALLSAYRLDRIVYPDAGERAREAYLSAYALCREDAPYSAMIGDFAVALHRICAALGGIAPPSVTTVAAKAREILDASASRRVSLEALSRDLYISPSQLIRDFRREYRVTPYEYLVSLRMETAKRLLRGSSLPVREIAARLCFSDEHYFGNVFKARVGVPPGQYRRG